MRDAVAFLTVLPVGRSNAAPTSRALAFFPLVGLLVGAAWWLAALLLGDRFGSAGVAAALILIVDAILTGGLHLDAFADVADGAASRRPPDEAMAIMREPAIGAIGALALILICLLRYGALTFSGDFGFRLFAAPVAGRAAMVMLIALLPAPQDSSSARAFASPPRTITALAVVVSFVAVLPSGARGLVALGLAGATAALYGVWWQHRFGGISGDGVGAGGLLAETVALLALSAR